MFDLNRRGLLGAGVATGAGALAAKAKADMSVASQDSERFWQRVAGQFDATTEVIHLENGNWGMMPRSVRDAYVAHLDRANRDTSYYGRRGMGRDMAAVRERLAGVMAVPAEEVAFTRNATEALKALIGGYNQLKSGDTILYANLDYDSMQGAMEGLARRAEAHCVRLVLPQPATRQSLIDAYAEAFEAHPRLKLVLLTHLSHRTGLVLPVREIAHLARARGIDVIVDAAHSWRQLDFDLSDLDCDFVGLNGHKWLAAPLGVGILRIRKSALHKIDRDITADIEGPETIGQRLGTGTLNGAAFLTVPTALDFDEAIGLSLKAKRLRDLRDRWVHQVSDIAQIEVLTPDDPALYGAMTSLRLRGHDGAAQTDAVVRALLEQHRIFTVARDMGGSRCIRITPALFNTMADMDALALALRAVVRDMGTA